MIVPKTGGLALVAIFAVANGLAIPNPAGTYDSTTLPAIIPTPPFYTHSKPVETSIRTPESSAPVSSPHVPSIYSSSSVDSPTKPASSHSAPASSPYVSSIHSSSPAVSPTKPASSHPAPASSPYVPSIYSSS